MSLMGKQQKIEEWREIQSTNAMGKFKCRERATRDKPEPGRGPIGG
jgi:hypothetical protein